MKAQITWEIYTQFIAYFGSLHVLGTLEVYSVRMGALRPEAMDHLILRIIVNNDMYVKRIGQFTALWRRCSMGQMAVFFCADPSIFFPR